MRDKSLGSKPLLFEHDSNWVGVDTFSTYCLTNDLKDFSRRPTRCNHQVLGVSNTPTAITHKGQVTYVVTDDEGRTCPIHVPAMYYCPSIPYRVISPQNLDKQLWANNVGTLSEHMNSDGNHIELDHEERGGS
jgi:hypothetical protein